LTLSRERVFCGRSADLRDSDAVEATVDYAFVNPPYGPDV